MAPNVDGQTQVSREYFYAKYDSTHGDNVDTSTIDRNDSAAKSVFDRARQDLESGVNTKLVGNQSLSEKLSNLSQQIQAKYEAVLNALGINYETTQEGANCADSQFDSESNNNINDIKKSIDDAIKAAEKEIEQAQKGNEEQQQLTTYAKNGESFKATAKRLGFEEGTEDYAKFVQANSDAAGRSHGGWFKVGEDVIIPDELKGKVAEGGILTKEEGDAEVQKYADAQAAKRRAAAAAKKERMENLGLKDEKNKGKKMTYTVNGKEQTYTVVGSSKENGRILVKGQDGYHYVSHDGKLLKDAYVAGTTSRVKNGQVKLGKETYNVSKDNSGRTIVTDSNGKLASARSADGKNLKLDYVQNKQRLESSGAAAKMQQLKSAYQNAQSSFDAQMDKDGWAADVADGVSHLWNNSFINLTGNTASQVSAELDEYKQKLSDMEDAYKKGDIETFNKLQQELSSKNITDRVAKYNQSQDDGAAAVKTTAVVAASAAAAVATGGTSLVATAAVAGASTAAARMAVEVSDLASNNIDGDVSANLDNIAEQALVEGTVAALTAGTMKGVGDKILAKGVGVATSRTANTVTETGLSVVKNGADDTAGALVKAGTKSLDKTGGGIVKSAGNASASSGGKTAANATASAASQNTSVLSTVNNLCSKVQNGGISALSDAEQKQLSQILGKSVDELKTLGTKDGKSLYRELALKFHPDRNSGDEVAQAIFQLLGHLV